MLVHTAVLPMQPAAANGAKSPVGGGPDGPLGPPHHVPPRWKPPPHGTRQHAPGHPYAQNHPEHFNQHVQPSAGQAGMDGVSATRGCPLQLGGPGGVEQERHSPADHGRPAHGLPDDLGEDMFYMGGMRDVGAMLHATEVRSRSPSSAERRMSSLNAASATISNITKTSWADFQKCAPVLFFSSSQVLMHSRNPASVSH